MSVQHCSLKLDLRNFTGKTLRVLSDTIRSVVKQEHGYLGTKGLTDSRLNQWPVAIRFSSKQNRLVAYENLKDILSPTILKQMNIKKLRTISKKPKPVRFFN